MPDMIVASREATGKEIAKKLRFAGKLPAVLYGEGKPAVSLSVDEKSLLAILKSRQGLRSIINFEMEGTGQKRFVMVKDYQLNALTGRLTHADFIRIDMAKPVRVKVPVHAHGEAAGVKQQGGVFELLLHEVEVECLPASIPDEIKLDVSALMINDSIRLSDLALGEKVKLIAHDSHQPLCHVTAPRAEEEAAPAAAAEGAAAAEPEVIAKGKKEEEGAEGAAAAGKDAKKPEAAKKADAKK